VTLPHLSGLHAIPLPTPFSVGDVNVYLLEPAGPSEQLTLVDTGPRWDATEKALDAALAGLGHTVSDLRQILISHAHPDHYGLAAQLVSRSGATLSAHPGSRPALQSEATAHQQEISFYRHWFDQCRVPPSLQDRIRLERNDSGRYADPVPVDHLLTDGDLLPMAGRHWHVLSTPGHAGGLVCFFEPESRTLLSSDHLIARITSNPIVEPPPPGESDRPKRLLQYIQQLERVAALQPAVAYPGHGLPITDVAALVAKRIAFHQQRADRIYRELARRPHTVFELVQQLFPADLPPVHLFLALSEVQGHLDLLVHQNRAQCVLSQATCLWQPA
jgi:glyoxylase-like metal-dependent hydrolase (beta-lactamase superfamily II)